MFLCLSNCLCCLCLLINLIRAEHCWQALVSHPDMAGRLALSLWFYSLSSLVFLNKSAMRNFSLTLFILGDPRTSNWGWLLLLQHQTDICLSTNPNSQPINSLHNMLQTHNICQKSEKLKPWPVYLTFVPIFPFKRQWNTHIRSDFMHTWMNCKGRLSSDSSREEILNILLRSYKFALWLYFLYFWNVHL